MCILGSYDFLRWVSVADILLYFTLFFLRWSSMLVKKLPRSMLTYLLMITFGIGSWVAVNGIWAEVSILVIVTPECSKFPALIVLIIQVANIGPLIYTIIKYFFLRSKWRLHQFKFDAGVIMILIGIGVASTVLLSLFWNRNLQIFGSLHSVALLVLIFFLALVDCTSSVVFIPFMKYFHEVYLSALYIGEGMSGVLPTIFSLVQGSVRNGLKCNSTGIYDGYKSLGVHFSPTVYFLCLSAMMVICGVSFLSIILLPQVRSQMVNNETISGPTTSSQNGRNVYCESDSDLSDDNFDHIKLRKCCHEPVDESPSGNNSDKETLIAVTEHSFSFKKIIKILYSYAVLYICLGLLSMLSNGALSAISAYAFLPYGNSVYHIAVNLGLLTAPVISLVFLFFPSKSKVITAMTTAIAFLLGIYIIDMAVMYPTPLLMTQLIGKILIVSSIKYILAINYERFMPKFYIL